MIKQSRLSSTLAVLSAFWWGGTAIAEPLPSPPDLAEELASIRVQMAQQQARLEAQDQEIQRLRDAADNTWLSERRAEETKQLIRAVLADADTRASLLENGLTAGHKDGKFFLASADGGFLLNVGGFIQVRYLANFRNNSDDSPATKDDAETGFQIRRATLQFGGHVSSPKFTYFLQLTANRDSGVVEMEAATIGYKVSDALSIKVGRYTAGFLLEDEDVSATRQTAVERSLVNSIFTVAYVAGVELLITPIECLRVHLSINDGLRSGDTGGTGNDFQNDTSDFALTGRAELKVIPQRYVDSDTIS